MKIIVFKAGDGDSLLIHGRHANILVDGGRKTPFVKHVAPVLEQLHDNNGVLDLVCVSHIDNDHITGVVELYRRRTAWAAHHLMPGPRSPRFGEPPEIKRLWHNAFDTALGGSPGNRRSNASAIASHLAFHDQIANAVAALGKPESYGQHIAKIAQGAKLAIELDLRFRQSPMNIEFNGPAQGGLIQVEDDPLSIDINGVQTHILSPVHQDLERLREEWDDWVRANRTKVQQMKAEFRQRSGSANALEFLRFAAERAIDGDFDDITPPNLASITFLLEEGGQRILMTGDHAAQGGGVDSDKQGLLEGLERAGFLQSGGIHVQVLKTPHHGASANFTAEFARRVTADHYVFCANGRHHNPELSVVEAYIQSRLADDDRRSGNPEVGRHFKLWFNYQADNPEIAHNQRYIDHMSEVEATVRRLAEDDRFDFEFSSDGHFEIDLEVSAPESSCSG